MCAHCTTTRALVSLRELGSRQSRLFSFIFLNPIMFKPFQMRTFSFFVLISYGLVNSAYAQSAAELDNPYGLSALWAQGDFVAKATLLILVLMSMASWYVIFTKYLEQSKMRSFAMHAHQSFWSAGTVRQGTDLLTQESPFRFIAEKALEGASKHTGMLGAINFNDWVTMSIQRAINNVQHRMQDGLALLATVGSTAPVVGLFGTVWGIYNALVKIGMSGQASIDKVAGPVGESLIMTAIGLAVAVPAVLGYNWLVRRNKSVMEDVNSFGSDLHAVLLGTHGNP